TAFNFSKKLEERGFLTFLKKENDKRNTYVEITPEGEEIFLKTVEGFNPDSNMVFKGSLSIRDFYGRFPDIMEITTILRQIYGSEFIHIFDESFHHIEHDFTETENKVCKISS